MTVLWLTNRGKRWPEAAYAVPCSTCNVDIGKPCLGPRTHPARAERAEVFGFITVDELAGEPAAEPAPTTPDLLRIMESAE